MLIIVGLLLLFFSEESVFIWLVLIIVFVKDELLYEFLSIFGLRFRFSRAYRSLDVAQILEVVFSIAATRFKIMKNLAGFFYSKRCQATLHAEILLTNNCSDW